MSRPLAYHVQCVRALANRRTRLCNLSFVQCVSYLLCFPAAEIGGVEGFDLNTLLIGRPQPGVVIHPPAALLPPRAPVQQAEGEPIKHTQGWKAPIQNVVSF